MSDSQPITVPQWTTYLNQCTNGLRCPICQHSEWQTQQDNDGNVCDVKILDHSFEEDLNDPANCDPVGIYEAARNGKEYVPPKPTPRTRPESLLKSVIVLRCAHCGWVALFDRAFVTEAINE